MEINIKSAQGDYTQDWAYFIDGHFLSTVTFFGLSIDSNQIAPGNLDSNKNHPKGSLKIRTTT